MTRSWSVAVIGKLIVLAGAASFASVALAQDEPFTEAIVATRPEYPSAARSQHLTGSGMAVVQVDPKSGQVTSARILDSTGHKILDEAALKAFRQWRFKPGATSEVHIPISYVMRGYTSNAPNARAARLESQAREAFRRQDYDVTIRSATQALQLAPEKVSLRELRALAYYRKGDNDAAIRDYDEVIRLNPTLASAYVIRGSAYLVKGCHAKALADFNEAIRIDPKNASAYCDRADLEGEVREPDKALRDYDRAIQLAPKFQRAYFNRAAHFGRQCEYEKAIPDFTQAIRLLPNDLDPYAGRAKAYAKLGDRERAVADAKVAIKLKPTTEMSLQRAKDLQMRSTACSIVGQPEFASRDRREAIRLAPNDAGTHEALAWFLATCPEERFRNGSEAVSSAKTACEISHWEDSGYVDTLAAAYAEVGDFEQATKYQQQSLTDPSLALKARKEREERLHLYQQQKPYRDRLDGSR